MLGSTHLTAENDRSNSQPHGAATTTATSKNHSLLTLVLKALLFLFYILLTVYLLLFVSLVALLLKGIIERMDEALLAQIRSLLPSVTGFLAWVIAPSFVWGEITKYHIGV